MNENQEKQTLEMTHKYCHNWTNINIIIHTIFKEMKDNIDNFGRQLETIKKSKWKLKYQKIYNN